MKIQSLWVVAGVLALAGCPDGTGTDDTDITECDSGEVLDTAGDCVPVTTIDEYTGPAYLASGDDFGYECTGSSFTYWADLVGWGDDVPADLFITQDTAAPWAEPHTMVSIDYDESGEKAWDSIERSLTIVSTPGEVVSDSTTLFQCTDTMLAGMGWVVVVYDYPDGDQSDCFAWGDEDAVLAILDDAGNGLGNVTYWDGSAAQDGCYYFE